MMRCVKKRAIALIMVIALLVSFFPLLPLAPLSSPASADTIVSPDGWGWQHPLPQGEPLHAIWGTSSSDVFAVGEGGTILHYNGAAWSSMDSGTSQTFLGVCAISSSNVFAVGAGGIILHYNGTAWSSMTGYTSTSLSGVWGTSSSDVFAVGEGGTILHYNGAAWSTMSSGTSQALRRVWGSSSADVFAVGGSGTILHYNGAAWSTMTSGTQYNLTGIWGTSSSDVFAVGGSVLHYDGTTWSTMTYYVSGGLSGVWGSSSSNVFAVGGMIRHYNGSFWSSMIDDTSTYLYGVWGSSSSDVFAVGDLGTIMHYDGNAWSSTPIILTFWNLTGVWGSSSSDVFAVGVVDPILHYDGSTWSTMSSGTSAVLSGVWGTSSSNVFAVGSGGTILHYNGAAWSTMSSGTTNTLIGVWGSSSSDVFAVGDGGTILHYNGTAWSTMSSGTLSNLYDVWGSSSSDVFAVGGGGIILHYNGAAWSTMTSAIINLYGVWGSSSSDVFAVGVDGGGSSRILHYNGAAWSTTTSGISQNLRGVWGSSSSDVFAVGNFGTILHYNGSSWSTMSSCTYRGIYAIWGSSSSDVFAVGNRGTILHYPETLLSNQPPNQPSNVSPSNGATGVSLTATLQASAFSDLDLGDTHAASQWQIRTSAGSYSSPVFDSGTDTGNLTSITIPSGELDYSTAYYWHVRHQDNHGDWSDWSAETSFTTMSLVPSEQPQLKAPWEGTAKISQGNFGSVSHFDHGTWDNTYAIDVALPIGSNVLAPADGTVNWYDDDPAGSGGKELAIDHVGPTGKTFTTVYLHLSEIIVKSGNVKQGQIVAKSGDTGTGVTGPHLHFHIWSGVGSRDSHTIPIERLVTKQVGVDSDFREYDARNGDLDDGRVAGKYFQSNNAPTPPPNQLPVPRFSYSPPDGIGEEVIFRQTISFDASASSDPDPGDIITSYEWNFDDITKTGDKVTYSFETYGLHEVTLTVTDNHGDKSSLPKIITVSDGVQKYAPTLIFNTEENYFPTDPHGDDNNPNVNNNDVDNNHENWRDGYFPQSHYFPALQPVCYYEITGELIDYTVYQYWYYYAYNDWFNKHEHDFEGALVWVDSNGRPFYYALSRHLWWNPYEVSQTSDLTAFVELGGHGMVRELPDNCDKFRFSYGLFGSYIIDRSADCFDFRPVEELVNLADEYQDLNGDYYKSSLIECLPLNCPKVPWKKAEYSDPLSVRLWSTCGGPERAITARIGSPAELRVYDSQNNVTGVVNGEVRLEIPLSGYYDDTVAVFDPSDTYRFETVGTEEGSYDLELSQLNAGALTTFAASGIPTSDAAVHQYTVDWNTISEGKPAVTVKVDSNGDGTFERTVAPIVAYVGGTTNQGDYTVDARAQADAAVSKSGTGTPSITIAKYLTNPGSSFTGDIRKYIDVYVPDTTGVDQIEVRLYYTNAEIAGFDESSLRLYWWNGTAWAQCSDSGVNTSENYIWAKIRTDTTPTLSDLTGTPFGGGGEQNTPTGSPVTVNLPGAVVTFPSVTGEGATIETLETAPCGSLPSGLIASGLAHHITTTATYTGPVTVGIRYDDAGIPTEDDLRLFHCDGSNWKDVTTSVDTVNHIIYGQDATLSWWQVGGPSGPGGGGGAGVPVFPNIYIGIAAALGAGILAYFVRRRIIHQR